MKSFLSILFLSLTLISQNLWALNFGVDKIIEENDLQLVNSEATNIPLKYKPLVSSFGAISFTNFDPDGNEISEDYGCTATHIGRGYVLTAGHCVEATEKLQHDLNCKYVVKDIFNGSMIVELSGIDWGFRQGLKSYLKSKCEKIVAMMKNEDGVDFAIIKVSPYPKDFISVDMNRKAAFGDTVTVFSHPHGEPLQWSKLCGVERVQSELLSKNYLQHKCDTNFKSSGATIINAVTLKIVGIHDGGVNDFDDAGNISKTGMNYGTPIISSPLFDELKKLGF